MTCYRTIVADPPWPVKDSGPRTRSERGNWDQSGMTGKRSVVPYGRMSIDAIAALPVPNWVEHDAHLYLWSVNQFLEEAYDVARAWGFKPSTLLTWCKKPMGLGFGGTFVNTTEFVIFARRGSLSATQRVDSTWWEWRRAARHSAKPESFIDMVEQVSPEPRLEMFARRGRIGWDYYGDESLATAELPEAAA